MKWLIFPWIGMFTLAVCAAADEPLPRDPANIYGQFENGLKYIIRQNPNPPGRAEMYLHVRTGATNETEEQNGLAHFLEHMAFNGSRHFAPGQLVPLLSSMGMRFGADTNAHTSFHETVYKLNLPDVQPETLETGLKILSDYADGLLLLPEEIDRERGIILEELRTRRGPEERIRKQVMKTVFADTRLRTHDVIGDEQSIQSVSPQQFLDYWNTWYRPENMTLLVVGDVTPDDLIARARPWLGRFSARAPAREAKTLGLRPTASAAAYVFTDPELEACDLTMLSIRPPRPPVTTVQQYHREIAERIATWIVSRRYSDLVRSGQAPFRSASAQISDFLAEATQVSFEATGEPQDWNRILDALIAEITRAIDHGFTRSELELARAGMIADAEEAVKTESTRDNTRVIVELSAAVGLQRPILSARQRLDLLKQAFESLTADELHRIFREHFDTRAYLCILSMPSGKPDVAVPSPQDLEAATRAAWARKTSPPQDKELADRILASDPVPGTVVSTTTDPDLQITTVVFENGVVLHHRFSDYKKSEVQVRISLPGGEIEETEQTRGLSNLASRMLTQPATSRFTSTQIRDLMTGKSARMSGSIGLDVMSITVTSTPADLPAAMELVHAVLTDGRLEPSNVDEWKKTQAQRIREMKRTPVGPLQELQYRIFYGGDIRFAPLTEERLEQIERSAAEAWFHRIASSAAIEVAVCGEIERQDAIDLIARYLGSLPRRQQGFESLDRLRRLERGPGPYVGDATYPSVTPQAVAAVGFVTCDESNPDRRPLSLAASILSERLIERVREKERLAYGIGAAHRAGRGMPGTGIFQAGSMTDPHNAH
ncbi:MAG: insulinase family protein, partial [Phycisphaerae bacterium]|nr:insulinase family protein [Phycisphaerae bacterium]MDW8262905.1 insulinase family protein [Phycisphaerales bacterium]